MEASLNREKVPLAVTLVFYMLGNAVLLPWNFIITADSYWQYKFRNTTLDYTNNSDGGGDSGGDGDDNTPLTPLQISFMPTQGIVSNVFATVFFFVTSIIVKKVSERTRIYLSIGASFLIMVLTSILTFVDTDNWQEGFYVLTLIFVAILSMCTAITQGSASGLAGLFPSLCMATYMSGQAMAGVLSSLARIISLVVGEEPLISGLVFFLISDGILLLTLLSYFHLRRTRYYQAIKNGFGSNGKKEDEKSSDDARENNVEAKKSSDGIWRTYFRVFKKICPMGVSVAVALFITLSVFPSVVVYITSTLPKSRWTQVFFQPTITFLLFNVGDVMGREITRWVKWPGPKGWGIHIFGASRLIFIPLLLLCHGENKTFPTLFDHDAYYIIINLLFSISNGYIITLTVIYYQTFVDEDELEMGGAIMVAMIGLGLVVGSLISPALVLLWGPQ